MGVKRRIIKYYLYFFFCAHNEYFMQIFNTYSRFLDAGFVIAWIVYGKHIVICLMIIKYCTASSVVPTEKAPVSIGECFSKESSAPDGNIVLVKTERNTKFIPQIIGNKFFINLPDGRFGFLVQHTVVRIKSSVCVCWIYYTSILGDNKVVIGITQHHRFYLRILLQKMLKFVIGIK